MIGTIRDGNVKMEEAGVVTLSFWLKIKEEDAAFLYLLPALKIEARLCLKSPVTVLTALSRPSSPKLNIKIKDQRSKILLESNPKHLYSNNLSEIYTGLTVSHPPGSQYTAHNFFQPPS